MMPSIENTTETAVRRAEIILDLVDYVYFSAGNLQIWANTLRGAPG